MQRSIHTITRRGFVKTITVIAAGVGAVPLLSACGSDAPTTTTSGSGAAAPTTAPSSTKAPATAASASSPATSSGATSTTAASTATSASSGKTGGTLRVGTNVDPQSLDPHYYKAGGIDVAVINLLYDSLITFDRTMKVTPRLATAWEWTDDKTLRFTLRTGVTFKDGTPFNAAAAKTNLDRMAKSPVVKGYFGMIASSEATDDKTVVIKLSEPYAPLLHNLASPLAGIISPAAIDKYGDDLARNPVGTGQYELTEWVTNQHLTVSKNAKFWGTAAKLDKITFRPFPEAATRLMSFQAGELDVIQDPVPTSVKSLEQDPRFQIVRTPQLRNFWLGIENGDKSLENVKLRQAIAHAVDREALVTRIASGLADVANTLFPTAMLDLPSVAYPHDTNKAKQLLAEAGFAQGVSVNLWAPQGRYLKDKEIGEALQAAFKEVGINAELKIWEWGAYNKAILEHQQQLWLQGWGFIAGDADGIASLVGSKGAFNSFNLKEDRVDQLIQKGQTTTDEAQRKTIYGDLQKLLVQELATVVPIYFQVGFYAATKKVHDFYPTPLELLDFSQTWME